MEKPKSFLVLTFSLVIFTINVYGATSASYNVGGGNNKWDIGVDFNTWSKEHRFFTGDVLDEDTYRDCDSQNGTVFAKYYTGNDQVSLGEEKKFWFICDVEGYCLGGMRFGIEVNAADVAPPPVTATPPSNAGDRRGWSLWIYYTSFVLLVV